MLAYGRQVANAQRVILQQIFLLFRESEKRFALRDGQEFTTGHQTILTMNKAFENRDRSPFDDPPQLLTKVLTYHRESPGDATTRLQIRCVLLFKSLAY